MPRVDQPWLPNGFLTSCSAAVAPLMAMLMLPIAGAIAIALEQGEWYYFQRSMQNAADAAAIAAAVNNNQSGTGSTYQAEAAAVAAKFGFVDGVNHAAVSTAVVACPANTPAGATCYQSSISTVVPLSFSALVGFNGNAAYGAGRGELIPATAIATSNSGGAPICLGTLSTSTSSFQSNGGPKPDLAGCTIMSNGGATCTGHNLGATYGVAVLTDNGCGIAETSGAAPFADPYSGLASNIPANPCGGKYPQEPVKPKDPALPASNLISGTISSSKNYCGDIQLTGDISISGTNNIITIYNGQLDTNGHAIRTATGATATLVFTGTNGTYIHYPTGGGTVDINSPSSGVWKEIAIYQDPALTQGTSFTYSGNTPTWDISGATYFPHADITFSGAVSKSTVGLRCFIMIANSLLVNGSATIFQNDNQCSNSVPSTVALRTKLVQ